MAAKYYTHFLTGGAKASGKKPAHELAHELAHEWSGVVELHRPLSSRRELRELRSLLALNFALDSEDIRILQWARLH